MILICKVCGKRFDGLNRRSEHRDPKCEAVRRRYDPDREVSVIELTNGMYALVSNEDYEMVQAYTWTAVKGRNTYYAHTGVRQEDGSWKTVSLHRMIMNAKAGQEVDHRDGDGLNCIRKNMRFVSNGQNVANSLARSNCGIKGVYRDRKTGGYSAVVTKEKRSISLGSFTNPIKAALARDAKARELWGEHSTYNVPEKGERGAFRS